MAAVQTERLNGRAKVVVRIKPLSAEPGEGASGEPCERLLTGWNCERATVDFNVKGRQQQFAFPSQVVAPDMTQETMFEAVFPELIEGFVAGHDVNFLAFGQTGSGKTHTVFGPPRSLAEAARLASPASTGGDILRPEHGLFLRAALRILEAIKSQEAQGSARYLLMGSMVELHMENMLDLLNNKATVLLDSDNHLLGAEQRALETPHDIVQLAAAVVARTTNATLMNDVSSRSHCVTVLTLAKHDLGSRTARFSRFNFVDMMGSERAKGQNSAHDPTKNNKTHQSGWEGIYANYTLLHLSEVVRKVLDAKKKKKTPDQSLLSGFQTMFLTRLLASSLTGSGLTTMVLTLSQAPRSGNESYHSMNYGETIALLRTRAAPEPSRPFEALVSQTRKGLEASTAALEATTVDKYRTLRRTEILACQSLLAMLERL